MPCEPATVPAAVNPIKFRSEKFQNPVYKILLMEFQNWNFFNRRLNPVPLIRHGRNGKASISRISQKTCHRCKSLQMLSGNKAAHICIFEIFTELFPQAFQVLQNYCNEGFIPDIILFDTGPDFRPD
jgi:hypothetical protein